MPVPRAARRGAIDSVVSLSRLSEAPTASVRAVSPTADRIWRHSCASWGAPQVFAPPAACAVGPRLCRAQRPMHTHWVANTHRHGTYDSANRPACTVARVCAQRGRCRVHTCQCLLRANQRTKQAEPQPRGIHSAHHAQAGRSSTIGCRLGLALGFLLADRGGLRLEEVGEELRFLAVDCAVPGGREAEPPQLWGGPRRAPGATASLRAAQAALRGA